MKRFFFYIQYAARNLWRNRRWSTFAMLSVAAGVAAVVALRSLGLAITDSLTSNIRSSNHGDITVAIGSQGPINITLDQDDNNDVFAAWQIGAAHSWVSQKGGRMTDYKFTSLQVTAANRSSTGLLNFMTALFIDPDEYPLTQDIYALDPKGVPLGELFQGGAEVIISENLAESQDIEVGDEVRISGTEQSFVVRGIVPTEAEAGLRDLFAAFFGFVYFDYAMLDALQLDDRPNRMSFILPDDTSYSEITAAANELDGLLRGSGWYRVISVPRLLQQNEVIADITGRFVVVMGLGAMLIGGVGIINTMLVLVRRRTEEIAALKTFGLKGRQIAAMFMTEALLLGLAGSAVGSAAGSLLSRLTNAYGETFIQQPLVWRIYPQAILFGVVLGLVVTGVFGVMPVLLAVKVRPGIILRPNETHIPALGVFQSILVMLFVVFALGLIAGQVLGELPERLTLPFESPLPTHLTIGVIGVAVALAILGILVLILWVVVWLVGKFPSFGWIDLRMALTNLRSRRMRTATTLLAISTGMFALSSITFYGAGVREILQFTVTDTFGGNVLILSPATFADIPILADAAQRQLENRLDELGDAVQYRTYLKGYDGAIAQVNDQSYRSGDTAFQRDALVRERRAAAADEDWERVAQIDAELNAYWGRWVSLGMRDSDNPNLSQGNIIAGRALTPDDYGNRVAIVMMNPQLVPFGIEVGSDIIIEINGRDFDFEVVGITAPDEIPQGEMLGDVQIPGGTLDNLRPNFQMNTLQVHPDHMDAVLLEISSMPMFFPLNIAFIDGVLSRLIDQFSALPILVGLLSLAAAAVIMANTVALATLERRKQIGILKAVGLKSRRVLSIMLLENTLVSLLGGVLGIGLSALGVVLMSSFGLDDLVLIPDDARPVALALVVAAVMIGGVATFLSANPAVKERVLNVLRYE